MFVSFLNSLYQNLSFSASESFGAERSEAAKVARARMIQYASVVVYTIFLSEGRKMNFRVLYGSCKILNEGIPITLLYIESFCGLRGQTK